MARNPRLSSCLLPLILATLWQPLPAAGQEFTDNFAIERCRFAVSGRDNPYFSLRPGDWSRLEEEDEGDFAVVEITVTNRTKQIQFTTPNGIEMTLRAREIEEREWENGELVEVSRNWFARCRQTNDVFYFGEEVDLYEDGEIVGHDGAWQAGVDGAQPGIIIPARFLLGSRYYQEQAEEAQDRAENVEMELTVRAAGRTFRHCVRAIETSPLEPGHESEKIYCPGVGLVDDSGAVLTDYRRD